MTRSSAQFFLYLKKLDDSVDNRLCRQPYPPWLGWTSAKAYFTGEY